MGQRHFQGQHPHKAKAKANWKENVSLDVYRYSMSKIIGFNIAHLCVTLHSQYFH